MQLAHIFPMFQEFCEKFPKDCEVTLITKEHYLFRIGVKKGKVFIPVELRNDMAIPFWLVGPRKNTVLVSILDSEKLVKEVKRYLESG